MNDSELVLITLFVPPALLWLIIKVGMWRADRKWLMANPGKRIPVPGVVNAGCLWLPVLVLFVMLWHGASVMGVAPW